MHCQAIRLSTTHLLAQHMNAIILVENKSQNGKWKNVESPGHTYRKALGFPPGLRVHAISGSMSLPMTTSVSEVREIATPYETL